MKSYFKYILGAILTCCTTLTANAQPDLNIPVSDSPSIAQSIIYYGLEDMNGPTKFNVLTTITPDQPLQTLPSTNDKYRQRKDYIDGLGRPLQSVELRAHAEGFDIVKPYVYDSLGRERYQYQPAALPNLLPALAGFIKKNIQTQMRQFYDQAGADEQPYGRTDFEPSSLGRPLKQLSPGRNWVGANRGQEFKYLHNVDIEVLNWSIGREMDAVPQMNGFYAPGELNVTMVTDEDKNKSREYTDKNGRLLVKKTLETEGTQDHSINGYASTYYVYDDQGRLRYVIPPEAIIKMNGSVWDLDPFKEYCYSYNYDHRGRLIQKTIPGKEPEEFFYDKRDRLVMSRDGNLKKQDKMLFTIYDALDRPIVTGIVDAPYSREAVVALLEDSDTYNPTDFLHYIKNYDLYNIYPPDNLAGCEMLTHTYYDNYDRLPGFNYDASQFNNEVPGATQPELEQPELSTVTRGLVTGGKVRVSDPEDPGLEKWNTTANYYDNKGRLLQTQTRNLYEALDISSNLYYFQGMLWKNILRHQNPNAQPVPGALDSAITTFTLVKTSTRNIRNRGGNDLVSKLEQKINTGPVYNISEYHYDHLNRAVLKDYSSSKVLNEYNMRGFLNHTGAKGQIDGQITSLFDERIRYDWGFKDKHYNGNIAGIVWNYSDGKPQTYGYTYDKLDRLTHAEYRIKDGNSWQKNNQDYSVSNIKYDPNGNILFMDQKAGIHTSGGAVQDMDRLTYNYEPNTNKLISVEDGGAEIAGLPDFRNGASDLVEYKYDLNGNMIEDANKKLTITYNLLNKPIVINVDGKGSIYYTYDATGNLLKKVVDSNAKQTVYDYFGNFVYKDNVLQYILNEEGRSRPVANDSTGGYTRFVYDYFIKDHLGNVRSTVTAEPINSNYMARHEIATANLEQLVFDNIPNVRDAKPGSIDPNDGMAAHLDANNPDTRVGTAIMLKVMPGDKFTISASAHYEGEYRGGEGIPGEALIESLTNALMGGGIYAGVPVAELPDNIRTIQNILGNPALPSQLMALQSNDVTTAPKAHLNYLFFDDKMQLQPDLSGSVQISPGATSAWEILNPGHVCNCVVNQTGSGGVTGFILVYVDNQSLGKNVWFDDVHIEHYTSTVLEENHYYPFGLTVGVGQTGQPNLPGQPYRFQGQRHDNDLGLNIYSFKYREHDPQIGRFWQIDPLSEKFAYNSPYAFSENKVTSHFELEGLEAVKLNDGNMLYGPWSSNHYNGRFGEKRSLAQTVRSMVKNAPKTPRGEGYIIETIVRMYKLDKINSRVYQKDDNGTILSGEKKKSDHSISGNEYFNYNSVNAPFEGAMDAAILVQAHEYMHIGQKTKLDLDGNENHIKREFFANVFNVIPNEIKNFEGSFFPEGFKNDVIWPEKSSESNKKNWKQDVERFYKGLSEQDREKYKELFDFAKQK